ncbi:hypothetical protein Mapa_009919 [Marchantia paleacea]|nr:hypothetical protein Mapa_009919 [Marchantia paleacea]
MGSSSNASCFFTIYLTCSKSDSFSSCMRILRKNFRQWFSEKACTAERVGKSFSRSCKMSFATCCREHRQWTVQYITAVSSSQLQRARELKGSLISSLREKVDVCFDKFRQLGVALLYIALDKSLKMEAAETARMKKSLHDRDGTCSRFSKVEDDSAWFESSFKLE